MKPIRGWITRHNLDEARECDDGDIVDLEFTPVSHVGSDVQVEIGPPRPTYAEALEFVRQYTEKVHRIGGGVSERDVEKLLSQLKFGGGE